jgi:hypothetical protein
MTTTSPPRETALFATRARKDEYGGTDSPLIMRVEFNDAIFSRTEPFDGQRWTKHLSTIPVKPMSSPPNENETRLNLPIEGFHCGPFPFWALKNSLEVAPVQATRSGVAKDKCVRVASSFNLRAATVAHVLE